MMRTRLVFCAGNRHGLLTRTLPARLLLLALLVGLGLSLSVGQTRAQADQFYLEPILDWAGLSVTTGNTTETTLASKVVDASNPDPVRGIIFRASRTGPNQTYSFNVRRDPSSGGGVGIVMNSSFLGNYRCSRSSNLTPQICTAPGQWSTWGLNEPVVDHGSGAVYAQPGQTMILTYHALGMSAGQTMTFTLNYLALVRYGTPPTLTANFGWLPFNVCKGVEVNFTDESEPSDEIVSWDWDFDDGETSSEQNPTHVFDAFGIYDVSLTVSNGYMTDEQTWPIAVGSCVYLGRPLTLEDQQASGLFDSHLVLEWAEDHPAAPIGFNPILVDNGAFLVHALSQRPGAYVHAAADGTVLDITPLTWEMCSEGAVAIKETELTVTNFSVSHHAPWCTTQLPNFSNTSTSTAPHYLTIPMFFDVRDIYIVKVSYEIGQTLNYIVKNAPLYVTIGDSILKKCILGETTAFEPTPTFDGTYLASLIEGVVDGTKIVGNALGAVVTGGWGLALNLLGLGLPSLDIPDPAPLDSDFGITWLWLEVESTGLEEELLPMLLEYPASDDFCNLNAAYAECQSSNPEFRNNGQQWIATGDVQFRNPGITLDPGEGIRQQGNLDSSTAYSMVISAESIGTPGEMRYWIGGTAANAISVSTQPALYEIPSDTHDPDAGSFYTYGIQNTGDTAIEIKFLCVSEGEPNLTPNSCYFANPTFDYGTQDWTVTENVLTTDGAIVIQLDDTISQLVTLYPDEDGAHTYEGYIIAQAYFTGEPELDGLTYQLQYEWPAGGTPVDIGHVFSTDTGTYPDAIHPQTLSRLAFSFEVAEETTGNFVITANITAANSSFVGVRIFEACIAGPFPQQGGGGQPPPFNEKCGVITKPQGEDFSAWTEYHWQQLNRFFSCDLMVMLNRMYKTISEGVTLFGWQARYWQSTAIMGTAWMKTDLFPYLNGHFSNIATGTGSGGSVPGLWDVLLALINGIFSPIINTILGLINQAATLLFSVLSGILTIFFALLGQIIGLVGTLIRWLTGLVGAWNGAAPTQIPGLPTCGIDPKGGAFCIALWFIENTILATNAGKLIIPLVIGFLSFELIEWVVNEIRRIITTAGKVA